jgi:hypothetical protein
MKLKKIERRYLSAGAVMERPFEIHAEAEAVAESRRLNGRNVTRYRNALDHHGMMEYRYRMNL